MLFPKLERNRERAFDALAVSIMVKMRVSYFFINLDSLSRQYGGTTTKYRELLCLAQ